MMRAIEDDEGLEPTSVLPEQLFIQRVPHTPERRLMIAVLEDAFHTYCKLARWPRCRRFRETAQWFASSDRTWLFSFERICDVLDLEPSCVRRRLLARRPLPRNLTEARADVCRSLLAAAG